MEGISVKNADEEEELILKEGEDGIDNIGVTENQCTQWIKFKTNGTSKIATSLKWLSLATLQFENGNTRKAYDSLTRALLLNASSELYSKRSLVLLWLEDYLLASADATSAISYFGKRDRWSVTCVEIKAKLSNEDQALVSGYFCRALAAIHLQEWELALKDLSRLRDCRPNSRYYNDLYVKSRNCYRLTGEILPFDLPDDRTLVPVLEPFSIFDENTVTAVKLELSSSKILVNSSLTEDFVKRVIETYKRRIFHVPRKHVYMILKNVLDIFKESPNIVDINLEPRTQLTVVGDLQGNFNNLMAIFNSNRSPRVGRPYVFNGNMVGEYKMGLPCVIVIFCLKILFPCNVFIARGREECLESCVLNGFEKEVQKVYDEDIATGFAEVFNWLPLGHLVNNKVFIAHEGSFEKSEILLEDLQKLKRGYQPPENGSFFDVLFLNPQAGNGINKAPKHGDTLPGPDIANRFCAANNIDFIIRSHQISNERGFSIEHPSRCLTINSSTKSASYIKIDYNLKYNVIHGRHINQVPKECECFLACHCSPDKRPKKKPCPKISLVKPSIKIPCKDKTTSVLQMGDLSSSFALRPDSKLNKLTAEKSLISVQLSVSQIMIESVIPPRHPNSSKNLVSSSETHIVSKTEQISKNLSKFSDSSSTVVIPPDAGLDSTISLSRLFERRPVQFRQESSMLEIDTKEQMSNTMFAKLENSSEGVEYNEYHENSLDNVPSNSRSEIMKVSSMQSMRRFLSNELAKVLPL